MTDQRIKATLAVVERSLRDEFSDVNVRIWAQRHHGQGDDQISFLGVHVHEDDLRRLVRKRGIEILEEHGVRVQLDSSRDVYDFEI